MSAAEIALKPCPFCGGEAEVRWYDGFPSASCTKCGCNTGMNINGSEREAIAAWNRRTILEGQDHE